MQAFAFGAGNVANPAAPATVIAPRCKNLRREMPSESEFSKEVIESQTNGFVPSIYGYA